MSDSILSVIQSRSQDQSAAVKATYATAIEAEAAGGSLSKKQAEAAADAMEKLGFSVVDYIRHVGLCRDRNAAREMGKRAPTLRAEGEELLRQCLVLTEQNDVNIRLARELRQQGNAKGSTASEYERRQRVAEEEFAAVLEGR